MRTRSVLALCAGIVAVGCGSSREPRGAQTDGGAPGETDRDTGADATRGANARDGTAPPSESVAGSDGSTSSPGGCVPREIAGGVGKWMSGVLGNGSGVAWGGAAIPGSVHHVETVTGRVCALFEDHSISCWVNRGQPPFSVPGTYQAMVMGQAFGCGIRMDGSVSCWGTDGVTQMDPVPTPPAGTFTRLVSDTARVCGLRTDGSVACFSTYPPSSLPSQPPPGPFVDLALLRSAVCGLLANGQFQCWADAGMLWSPFWREDAVPTGPYKSITFGLAHACGLKPDGTLICWDNNGVRTDTPTGTFKQIVARELDTCGIGTDGVVLCWGENGDVSAPADFGCCRPDFADDFSVDPRGRWSEPLDQWAWSAADGSFSVIATGSSGTPQASSILLPHQSAWTNVDMEAVIKVDSGSDGGILIRSSGNAYYVALYPAEKKIRLRFFNSTIVFAEADADIAYGEYHRIGISAAGCNLSVSLDGAQILTATDNHVSGGTVGLVSNGGSVTCDSLRLHCTGGSACLADPSSPIPL